MRCDMCIVPVVACAAAGLSAGAFGQPALVQERASHAATILQQVPDAVHAVFLVPHLKRASDEFTRMLEGMDRANTLLGARPIDHLKSITGLASGLNDHGAAAIIVVDAFAHPPKLAAVATLSDAEAFLQTNFSGREGEAYARADGTRLFLRMTGMHVWMAREAESLDFLVDQKGRPAIDATVDAALRELSPQSQQGETIAYFSGDFARALAKRAEEVAGASGVALPAAWRIVQELASDARSMALDLDCDPLGLVIRGEARWNDDSDFGTASKSDLAADAGLARFDDSPFSLAMHIDVHSLGGPEVINGLGRSMTGDASWTAPASLHSIRSILFRAAPSAAGAKGGMLNDAVAMLATPEPDAALNRLADDIAEHNASPDVAWIVQWNAATRPGGSKVVEWGLSPEGGSGGGESHAGLLQAMLFGAARPAGFAAAGENAIVMTFSRRPALLENALAFAGRDGQGMAAPAGGLDSHGAVRTIRRWLPQQRDVEAYVNPARLREVLLAGIPAALLEGLPLPAFDPEAPPLGVAIDVKPHRAAGAAVIPHAVLAPIFDEAFRQIRQRAARERSPAAEQSP